MSATSASSTEHSVAALRCCGVNTAFLMVARPLIYYAKLCSGEIGALKQEQALGELRAGYIRRFHSPLDRYM